MVDLITMMQTAVPGSANAVARFLHEDPSRAPDRVHGATVAPNAQDRKHHVAGE